MIICKSLQYHLLINRISQLADISKNIYIKGYFDNCENS